MLCNCHFNVLKSYVRWGADPWLTLSKKHVKKKAETKIF